MPDLEQREQEQMEQEQIEQEQGERKEDRGLWLKYGVLLAVLLVLAAAVTVVLIHALRGGDTEKGSEKEAEPVTVNDGLAMVEIVPNADLPVNERRAEDFTAEGDLIRYSGESRQGIDVSEFQGAIDWQQVADSGVEFVFLRLGYRGLTEGGLYEDAQFRANLRGAQAAGLDVGVYFFSQALNEEEAEEEAAFALNVLDGKKLALPVIFDWEKVEQENVRTQGMASGAVTDCALAFCRRIAAGKYQAGVYFNRQQGYYDYDLSQLKKYTFWISDPNTRPDFYYDFSIWQYSFDGVVPGIGTKVDRNILFT